MRKNRFEVSNESEPYRSFNSDRERRLALTSRDQRDIVIAKVRARRTVIIVALFLLSKVADIAARLLV